MKIAFYQENKRYKAYGVVDISINGEIKETSNSKLNSLVPDRFKGGWKENRRHFKLDDSGQIVFDENFEPKKLSGKN